MSVTKLLTSAFEVQVKVSSAYVTIGGLNSILWNEDAEDIDITDFDAAGWGSTMPGIRTASVEVEGFRLADSVTGVRDAGQKAVEGAARSNGFASRRDFRIVWKDDDTQFIAFSGYAKNGEFGGGLNEAAPWSASILVDGAPTFTGAMFDPTHVAA